MALCRCCESRSATLPQSLPNKSSVSKVWAIGTLIDLAFDMDHAYHAAERLGVLTTPQAAAIAPLDEFLKSMSGSPNSYLWTLEQWRLPRSGNEPANLARQVIKTLPAAP